MVVVRHQNIRVDPEPRSRARLPKRSKKCPTVLVVSHDRLPTVTPRHHVIQRTSKLKPHLSWHRPLLAISEKYINIKWLTPFVVQASLVLASTSFSDF
jgi:hypothetical protein